MNFIIKLCITVGIIILCTQMGRKYPTLAGLIATMPLTGAIVFIWLHFDNPGDYNLLTAYTKGALLGIVPSILFFLVAFFCLQKHLPLAIVFSASFGIWLVGACLHQWFLK